MSKGRVLVVEDERLVAADIAITLTRSGYAVTGRAASGPEALARAEATRPDVALMDIALQGPMDGVEAARRMVEDLRIPVVYLTAHADGGILDRAKETHPLGYVIKPFRERDLLATLELAFHRLKTEPAAGETMRAALDARDEVTRRIAGELHDEAGQLLAALHIAIDELARGGERLNPERASELKALVAHIEEQIRRIAHEMHPRIVDDLGLQPALEYLAGGVSQRSSVQVNVRARYEGRLPAPVEATIYRIAQEALTNAIRHGRARRVEISVVRLGGFARCAIEDDGIGFDATARRTGGLGLAGMRERAEVRGGTLRVRSQPGHGTVVEALIPVPGGPPSPPAS
jgi:signal transduction histidine kinase